MGEAHAPAHTHLPTRTCPRAPVHTFEHLPLAPIGCFQKKNFQVEEQGHWTPDAYFEIALRKHELLQRQAEAQLHALSPLNA